MTRQEKYEKSAMEYQKGVHSITKIANDNFISRGRLSKFIKSKGIEVVNEQNKITFDENVFEEINTEEKAYWLGFIYADGNISKGNRNVLEISLQLGDFDHLTKFYSFIKSNKKVKIDSFRCRAFLGSKKLKKDLVYHGCVPIKSEILKFPITIPKIHVRHFIRGYYDGDGYLGIEKRASGREFPKIGLLGTWDMLINVMKLSPLGFRTLHYSNPGGSTKIFQFSADSFKAIPFLDYIYKDCNIYLDRKYKKYIHITKLPMYAEMHARNGGIKQETPPS